MDRYKHREYQKQDVTVETGRPIWVSNSGTFTGGIDMDSSIGTYNCTVSASPSNSNYYNAAEAVANVR